MIMSELDPASKFPTYPADTDGNGWAATAVDIETSVEILEKEVERLNEMRAEAIRRALDAGVKAYEGYKLQARYKEGEKFVVDAGMLKTAYPEIHNELLKRAIRDIKLKPSKKEVLDELAHIIGDEESAKAAIENCGYRVKTETQYILTKGESQ